MKKQATSLHFNRNLQRESLSNTKKQGLLTGLLAGMTSGFYIDSLETGVNKIELQGMLTASLWFKNESSITAMMSFLQNEGDRTAYAIMRPHLSTFTSKEELDEMIRSLFFGVERFIQRTDNLYRFLTYTTQKEAPLIGKQELERGILAWDMGRLVNLARVAYETENITKEKAWKYIELAGEKCQNQFDNWEEIGKSFLLGQVMEATSEAKQALALANFKFATESRESPWKE